MNMLEEITKLYNESAKKVLDNELAAQFHADIGTLLTMIEGLSQNMESMQETNKALLKKLEQTTYPPLVMGVDKLKHDLHVWFKLITDPRDTDEMAEWCFNVIRPYTTGAEDKNPTISSDNTQTVYNLLEERKAMIADIELLRESLVMFRNSSYPVAKEINIRGYNWSEAYLDDALSQAILNLAITAKYEV